MYSELIGNYKKHRIKSLCDNMIDNKFAKQYDTSAWHELQGDRNGLRAVVHTYAAKGITGHQRRYDCG